MLTRVSQVFHNSTPRACFSVTRNLGTGGLDVSTFLDVAYCRDAVLDIVLQVAEALSISDDHATQLAANPKFLSLACQVIRLSSRDEVQLILPASKEGNTRSLGFRTTECCQTDSSA